jgi:hypothetical protein
MPHAVYLGLCVMCPWPGCDCRIQAIDFQLELSGDAAFYAQVMLSWGRQTGFGLVGKCPTCGRYVLYGVDAKLAVDDPSAIGCPVLPDDWHQHAYVV